MSHEEESPGQTQDTLERLYLSAGLGMPQYCPGYAGGSGCLGRSGILCLDCCTCDPGPDKQEMDV